MFFWLYSSTDKQYYDVPAAALNNAEQLQVEETHEETHSSSAELHMRKDSSIISINVKKTN